MFTILTKVENKNIIEAIQLVKKIEIFQKFKNPPKSINSGGFFILLFLSS